MNLFLNFLMLKLALIHLAIAQISLLGQSLKALSSPQEITGINGNFEITPPNQKDAFTQTIQFGPAQQKTRVIETVKFAPINTQTKTVVENFQFKATPPVTTGGTFSTEFNLQLNLEQILEKDWTNFKKIYNKNYTPEEEQLRREIFIENRQSIIDFNTKYSSGETTFTQQLNAYADLLPHEFNLRFNGFNRSSLAKRVRLSQPSTYIPSANVIVPPKMDWREQGAVTGVKTQGDCMGCYAFAAAGALESHTYRKTGKLVDLSPQQILDCSKGYGNEGCNGGLMTDAYEYVKNQPGLDTWDSYPYEGRDTECRFKPETVEAYCTGFVELPEGDEKAMEHAVATIGPVTVAIDASQRTFQFYRDGVYFDPNCKNKQEDMNHGVLIVGFGEEPDGKKYWIVKNSYGPQWGNGGFVKMAKEAGNHCGIANSASYPLV